MADLAGGHPSSPVAVLEPLAEAECLRLISPGGIGRIAYSGRYGLTVLPVNYQLYDGAIMFRTSQRSLTGEDLRTGIAHAEYQVAFEIDHIDPARARPPMPARSSAPPRNPCGAPGRG